MPEAVLVSALRTPIGTAFKGTLRDTTAFDLAHRVVSAAAAGLDPDQIDDVILGEGLYGGGVIARHAAITAGLPAVPGLAQNRHCAASLAAVQTAAAACARAWTSCDRGRRDSASTAPRSRLRVGGDWLDPWVPPTHPDRPDAPNWTCRSPSAGTRVAAGVTRDEMDAWAFARTAMRFARSTRAVSTRRSSPSRRRTAPSVWTSTRAATRAGETGRAQAAAPGDRGVQHHRGQRLRRQRRRGGPGRGRDWLGLPAARRCPVLGVGRRRPGADRAGPGAGDTQGPGPGRPDPGRRGPLRDQRGVRLDVRGHGPPARTRPGPRQRQRQRLLPRSPGRRHRRPDAGHLVYELRRRGGGIGVAAMCAGGGMGSAPVIEVPAP